MDWSLSREAHEEFRRHRNKEGHGLDSLDGIQEWNQHYRSTSHGYLLCSPSVSKLRLNLLRTGLKW